MMQRRLHGWRRLCLMPLLLLTVLLLVLAVSLVRPGTAHAQSGATITIASTGHLIARTTVQISTTVSCTPPAGMTYQFAGVGVTISQASGRQIVQAEGSFDSFPLTPCDGTAHTLQVEATPQAGSAPFHGGPALATAGFDVVYIDASGNQFVLSASTPLQVIRIKG